MASRRKNNPNEPPIQSRAFSRPGTPTLTLTPKVNSTSLYLYYPETQSKGMKSSMRPRGGFIDRSLAQLLGTDTGFVAAKAPPKYISEPGSIDPASESVIPGSSQVNVLPRWNEFSVKERGDREQQEKQWKEDRSLRRHSTVHKPPHSFEDGMRLDGDLGIARVDEKQNSDAKESRDGSVVEDWNAVEAATRKPLGRRFNAQGFTGTIQDKTTDTKSLIPAPESYSAHELNGIDSLTHNTPQNPQDPHYPFRLSSIPATFTAHHSNPLRAFLSGPFLWLLSIVGIILLTNRWYRWRTRTRRGTTGGKRARREERRERGEKQVLLDEEEARWEITETYGMVQREMMRTEHEHVLWERTSTYLDPEYDGVRIEEIEMVVISAPYGEDLFPGAEAGPDECVGLVNE